MLLYVVKNISRIIYNSMNTNKVILSLYISNFFVYSFISFWHLFIAIKKTREVS